jgi:hypothetical protein
MASNGSPDRGTWRPRRGRILLLIGLLLLAFAAWRFASRATFADRAVTTTAVIDDLSQGPFLQSEDGRRSFTVYATVRYDVDGTLTQGRVALSGCRGGACPARRQRATRSPSPTTHGRSPASTLPAGSSAAIPSWTRGCRHWC